MPDSATLALMLDQARHARQRQDDSLQALRNTATGALIVLLTAGTIAVAASQPLAPDTLVVVFYFALGLGANLLWVELVAHSWKDGPSIATLLGHVHDPQSTIEVIQITLLNTLDADHRLNKRTLTYVRWLVFLQAAIAFLGLVVLLAGFRELT